MSNIPRARKILDEVLKTELKPFVRKSVELALSLMVREGKVRPIANPISQPVTKEVKRQIRRLAHDTNLSLQDIANRAGVNPGRVSEVLHGRR